uniref:Uncharacterized protein LOC114342522 n=1 Tax=Diabrotica virgifera virgifera TaxID=50390 RepID=A0A6P7GH35_DIAVI
MTSTKIRSRLLESLTLTLEETYDIATSMEIAELNSQVCGNQNPTLSVGPTWSSKRNTRFFRGGPIHPRKNCLAQKSICKSCDKKRHFAASRTRFAASRAVVRLPTYLKATITAPLQEFK